MLALREDDVTKMLVATTHLGSENVNFQMEQYVYKRRTDGVHVINLRRTWEKLLLAARAIAAIEHPAEVFAISSRSFGQRAVLKYSSYTGATPIAGRFTPGAFTNQVQAAFREPRLLIVTDPRTDHQPVTEASYVNIPVIAFCNTDAPLRFVDICIPCNTKSSHSAGLMWWMLSREVLRLRGTIPREGRWEVVVDLFFYRDPEETEKEEQAAKELMAPAKSEQPALAASAEEAVLPEGTATASWEEGVVPVAAAAAATTTAATTEGLRPLDEWGAETPQTGAPGSWSAPDWNV